MSRRRSRRNEERRRQIMITFAKLVLVLGGLGMVVFYAYEVGYRVAQGEVASLKEQVGQQNDELARVKEQAEGDRAALNEQRKQAEELRSLYDQTKPSEELRDLVGLMRARLASGLDGKRLTLAIKSAQTPRHCEAQPPKRFMIRTPRFKGAPGSTEARLDDALVISADGVGANEGREQWFDPDQAVHLHLGLPGAKDNDTPGKLPLELSVGVKANTEVHFTVSASATRGYADVVSERCDLK